MPNIHLQLNSMNMKIIFIPENKNGIFKTDPSFCLSRAKSQQNKN